MYFSGAGHAAAATMDCAGGGDPVEDLLLGGAGDDGDLAIFCDGVPTLAGDGGYGETNCNDSFFLVAAVDYMPCVDFILPRSLSLQIVFFFNLWAVFVKLL